MLRVLTCLVLHSREYPFNNVINNPVSEIKEQTASAHQIEDSNHSRDMRPLIPICSPSPALVPWTEYPLVLVGFTKQSKFICTQIVKFCCCFEQIKEGL